jgi:hypothetical protein
LFLNKDAVYAKTVEILNADNFYQIKANKLDKLINISDKLIKLNNFYDFPKKYFILIKPHVTYLIYFNFLYNVTVVVYILRAHRLFKHAHILQINKFNKLISLEEVYKKLNINLQNPLNVQLDFIRMLDFLEFLEDDEIKKHSFFEILETYD